MIETFDVPRKRRAPIAYVAMGMVLLGCILVWWLARPPAAFPRSDAVVIPRGLGASAIADLMKEHQVVRSAPFLYLVLLWRHDPSSIQAGTFLFDRPLSVFQVADRITTLGATEDLVQLTLPEGYTIKEFAGLASAVLPDFDAAAFINAASSSEGYLFPDTYYLPADFTAAELLALQQETYAQKTAPLQEIMNQHPLGEAGVITLASLLEREANTPESMKMIAGILENRLREGMRLQIDASLEYVLDRPLHTLEAADLEIDSPYNTYRNDGLPPTPIGNPGLQAIEAVLDPTLSDYFYYLTDTDGNFHYAKTFDEHRANIAKYLK